MRELGFVRPNITIRADQIIDYLGPTVEPLRQESFTFTRQWLQGEAARIGDVRRKEAQVGRMLNLPPSYLLIHRVTLGSAGILCQLGATVRERELAERWQPGFTD
jgi:hypothetical protein